MSVFEPLLAVHITANVLTVSAVALGFVGLAVLLAIGLFRLREEEIPRIALVTAALFVASSIHVSLGPATVHLLLNGLAGVVLGRRVCVAIPIGLVLQAALVGHGDFSTLGVNACVMTIPALLSRPLFRELVQGRRHGLGESVVAVGCVLFPWSVLATGPLLLAVRRAGIRFPDAARAGFGIGAGSVLLTSVLHSLVLVLGGEANWSIVAGLSLAAHVPVAVVEGLALAATADFLMRARPELLLPERLNAVVPPAETPHPRALPTVPAPR